MTQAIGIYDFKAADDTELSIYKNEILDIVEKSEDWWTVRNKYGRSGLVPVNYLAAPIPDDSTEVVARGKTKKPHIAKSENEASIEAEKQVAILDKSDNYWWFVGFCGKTGYIPKRIINEFKKPPNKDKEKEEAVQKFGFKQIAPVKALCEEETTVLFSFQKPLPEQGQYKVIFKGEHCEKVQDGERLNDFTIQTKTPNYYPAEKTHITINHQQTGQAQQLIVKGVDFMFQSKLDVVHKILSKESDPLNFLCSSFQIGDLQNVDHILSGNFEKKVPEGIDLLKSSKSVLVHEQVLPKETPTLLHFAAYYNLKKLAKALLRCPGAKEAMSIKNCHGNGPVGVAKLKKHDEMEQLLQDHQANENIDDLGDEDEYMSMERCYDSYVKMGGKSPQYVVPDYRKHSDSAVDDPEQLYEDMEGGKSEPEELYDTPRLETEDRFDGYDEQLDDNENRIQQDDSAMQRQIEEYKVFGRMTEKEVQLALLMKRVKERYITQEQALDMARVLRLEPQVSSKSTDWKKKKPKVKKRVSVPNMGEVQERKTQSLPRTMSTSSGSSVSSVGSTGSGYSSDGINNRPPTPAKIPAGARPFSYLPPQPQVSPKKAVAPPPLRKPPTRTPSDPAPPVPSRRGARR